MRDKYLFQPAPYVPASHEVVRDQVAEMFNRNKQARKARSNEAEARLRGALGQNPPNAHPALHQYEQDHLRGGGDWAQLRRTIAVRFPGIEFVTAGDEEVVYARVNGQRRVIGSVFKNGERFVRLAVQPAGLMAPVYTRREDARSRHYVQLPNSNTYVRRFVTRGLNCFDGMNLSVGQALRAVIDGTHGPVAHTANGEVGGRRHGYAAGHALTENEQILSHTRGWGGRKRYISTGVSNRPAFSTRGTQFTSIYGVVVIDLARLDLRTVFDVHRHDLATDRLGLPATDVLRNQHHTNTQDLAEERYLALRDVIRTRELLIKRTVPYQAVLKVSQGRRLLGIGSVTNNENDRLRIDQQVAALPAAARLSIRERDHLTFRDPHSGRRWHLIEFTNPAVCQLAYNEFALRGQQIKVRFHKYAAPRPAGMV